MLHASSLFWFLHLEINILQAQTCCLRFLQFLSLTPSPLQICAKLGPPYLVRVIQTLFVTGLTWLGW